MRRLRGAIAVLAACMISAALAEEIGWQEAVARLAYERTKAETCVKELKKYGDKAAVSRGEDAYNDAKAEYDAIVSGLTVALAKKGEPESLLDLEARMQRGFEAREAFCKSVQPLIPSTTGQRSPIADIVGGAVGPVIDALKAIWMRKQDDDALMRETIENSIGGDFMAGVRFYRPLALILLLWTGATRAENPQNPPQLYDRPVLAVDPGTHTATITSASADHDGRWAVTGSDDKTVRIWSLADGKLERTIRLPAGPGDVGKNYAVAMSPDGALIAAGGWTRMIDADPQEQIYLFDRASGTLLKRIEGLPTVVTSLVFSPDGNRLAAGVGGGRGGLRVYAKDHGWDEAARDEDYGGAVYGADFAQDGRLATASLDGKVRLYTRGAAGMFRPAAMVHALGGKQPVRIAFSLPDGARLAVGYSDAPRVDLFDGGSLAMLPGPDVTGLDDVVGLLAVGWSRDGEELVAGGKYFRPGGPVFAWSPGSVGSRRLLGEGKSTVLSLISLPSGDLLIDEGLGYSRLESDGTRRWAQQLRIADFRASTIA